MTLNGKLTFGKSPVLRNGVLRHSFFSLGGSEVKRFLILAALIGLVMGCGSKPQPSLNFPTTNEIKLPERPSYRIAVGDLLSIKFFYYPNYNINVYVRPDGIVTIPLLGEVKAEGMKPSELEAIIRAKYSEVIAEPEVSVIVSEFAEQRVFVFGEVKSPGAVTYLGSMTIIDAIANAGGALPSGRLSSVILMRRMEDGKYVGQRINVDEILGSENPDNVYLMPRDIVYVPMTAIAKVDKFVEQFFHRITPVWLFYIYGDRAIRQSGNVIIGQ